MMKQKMWLGKIKCVRTLTNRLPVHCHLLEDKTAQVAF